MLNALRERCFPDYRARKNFHKIFGFEPEWLEEEAGQREALIILCHFAATVKKSANSLEKDPTGSYEIDSYKRAHANFRSALGQVHYFADLWLDMPHWTQLPDYLSHLLEGKTLVQVIRALNGQT